MRYMQSEVLGLCIAAVAICHPPIHTDNFLEDPKHSSSAYALSCRYPLLLWIVSALAAYLILLILHVSVWVLVPISNQVILFYQSSLYVSG